ncbi:MAG: reverse transcriptase family protein [Bdellovibrionales bacterium]
MTKTSGYNLSSSPFYKMTNVKRLAKLLGVTSETLENIANSKNNYEEWDDVKQGKVRHIEAPRPKLKSIQKKISKLLTKIEPPAYLFCPAKGRTYFENAEIHVGSMVIRKLDIKAFFQSTAPAAVIRFYSQTMKCAPHIAALLTKLTIFNNHLPTGSPLSPIMSYFAYRDMWDEIEQVVLTNGKKISLWMDDLIISGQSVPEKLMWSIKKIIHNTGLRYHTGKKSRSYFSGTGEVTGLIVTPKGIVAPHRTHIKIWKEAKILAEQKSNETPRLKGLRVQINEIKKRTATAK